MSGDAKAEIERLKKKLAARRGRIGFERNVVEIEKRIAELGGQV